VLIGAISYTIPRIGVAPTITLIVAGQLIIGALLDHFGLMGLSVRPLDVWRVTGIIVVFVGVWLMVK
jgi:transporter family-2 protein